MLSCVLPSPTPLCALDPSPLLFRDPPQGPELQLSSPLSAACQDWGVDLSRLPEPGV